MRIEIAIDILEEAKKKALETIIVYSRKIKDAPKMSKTLRTVMEASLEEKTMIVEEVDEALKILNERNSVDEVRKKSFFCADGEYTDMKYCDEQCEHCKNSGK